MIYLWRLLVSDPLFNLDDAIELHQLTKQQRTKLITAAHRHDLTPLLLKYLMDHQLEDFVSPDEFDLMREKTRQTAVQNVVLLQEARSILKILSANKIDVIGLKGVYLLDNIYSDISLRSLSDLDIMVRKSDVQKTISLFESLGYQLTTYFDVGDENFDIKHVPPLVKDETIYLEVHWTLLEENEPFTIDTGGLWKRAVPAEIAGIRSLALSLEDLVLHLCVHLTYQHHLDVGLRGLYDLHLLLSQNGQRINWDALILLSKQWGVERVAAVTFRLLREIFLTELPEGLELGLLGEPIPADMFEQAREQLLAEKRGRSSITPDLASLQSTKGFLGKSKLVFGRIFLPKKVMGRIYNVPPNSFRIYFYYLQRLVYLISNYALPEMRILQKDKDALGDVMQTEAIYRLKNWLGKL